jgi:hypothetical protein
MCVELFAVREEKEEFNDNGEFYCCALVVVCANLASWNEILSLLHSLRRISTGLYPRSRPCCGSWGMGKEVAPFLGYSWFLI